MDFLDSYYSQFFDNFNFFFLTNRYFVLDYFLICCVMMASLLQVSSIVYLVIALNLPQLDDEFCSHEIFKKQVFNFGLFHIYMHYAYRFISVYIIRIAICSHSLEIRDYCLMEGLQNLPYSILFGIQNPSNLFIS